MANQGSQVDSFREGRFWDCNGLAIMGKSLRLMIPILIKWVVSYRHRAQKPQLYNEVKTGFEWNEYNQIHYGKKTPKASSMVTQCSLLVNVLLFNLDHSANETDESRTDERPCAVTLLLGIPSKFSFPIVKPSSYGYGEADIKRSGQGCWHTTQWTPYGCCPAWGAQHSDVASHLPCWARNFRHFLLNDSTVVYPISKLLNRPSLQRSILDSFRN